ncbi:MAG: class I SAM-dependent methyltransferase [Calditrichaeota bacterium]|nr:class I SAM-dependent methyltransferase [Calditrichota bacterium]
MNSQPAARFNNRAVHYHQFRPRYPVELLHTLQTETGLSPQRAIADIGSGTGISSELFLQNGNTVFAVEPNADMRLAAESNYGHLLNFISVNGRAEATTLQDNSIHYIIAGQAFHWFDSERARDEFRRILKPEGWMAFFWNVRAGKDEFHKEYESFVRKFGRDYKKIWGSAKGEFERIENFTRSNVTRKVFAYSRRLDLYQLQGYLKSVSYMPLPVDDDYSEAHNEAKTLFDKYNRDGTVEFQVETRLYFGRMGG